MATAANAANGAAIAGSANQVNNLNTQLNVIATQLAQADIAAQDEQTEVGNQSADEVSDRPDEWNAAAVQAQGATGSWWGVLGGAVSGGLAGAGTGALVFGAVGVWFGGVGFLPAAAVGGAIGFLGGAVTGAWNAWNQLTFDDGWNVGALPGALGGAASALAASGVWLAFGAPTMEIIANAGGHVVYGSGGNWVHAFGDLWKMKTVVSLTDLQLKAMRVGKFIQFAVPTLFPSAVTTTGQSAYCCFTAAISRASGH